MQQQNSKALNSNSYQNNATKYVLSTNEQTKPTFSELNCVNSGELKVVPQF